MIELFHSQILLIYLSDCKKKAKYIYEVPVAKISPLPVDKTPPKFLSPFSSIYH